MNRNKLLLQEDRNFLGKMLDKITGKKKKSFKKDLIDAIALVSKEMKKQGKEKEVMAVINRYHPKKVNKLQDLINPARKIKEETELDEGFKDIFGSEIIKNAYNALSFYPILMVFLELDRVFRGTDGNMKIALVYLVMWLAIVSGKSEAQNIMTNLYQKAQDKMAKSFPKPNKIGFNVG